MHSDCKPIPWVAAFDVHGDKQHKPTVAAFHSFCREFKPQIRIAGGDVHDFRWLREKANEYEKKEDIADDIDAGNEFLAKFEPTAFIEGNHDWRVRKALETTQLGCLKKLLENIIKERAKAIGDCRFYRYDKREGVMQLGDFRVIHGFTEGIHAVQRAAASYGNVLMGHIHAFCEYALPTYPRNVRGYSSGCLAQLDLGYNNRTLGTLREENGWAYGWLYGKVAAVHFARRIGGQWHHPF